MKKFVKTGILVLLLLVPLAYGDLEVPLTVTWTNLFSSFYSGTICLDNTNIFVDFDNISVEYTYDDHSISPPSPRLLYLTDQGNNKYCSDLQPTLWDSNNLDTLANAVIKIRYGTDILFESDKFSTDVPAAINEAHLFNDYRKTFNMSLNKGWNLISIPLMALNNSVKDIFSSISYSDIFAYDSGWKVPTEIDNTLGYWINADDNYNLTIKGSEENTTLNLNNGWNLIGHPYLYGINMSVRVGNAKVYAYRNSKWHSYNSLLSNAGRFNPGFGYWVYW